MNEKKTKKHKLAFILTLSNMFITSLYILWIQQNQSGVHNSSNLHEHDYQANEGLLEQGLLINSQADKGLPLCIS